MNTEFKESFIRDLRRIRNVKLFNHIKLVIEQIEKAEEISGIKNLKKLKGKNEYFRIRIEDYRIGITIKDEQVTFVRVLNRKEIYRFFPNK